MQLDWDPSWFSDSGGGGFSPGGYAGEGNFDVATTTPQPSALSRFAEGLGDIGGKIADFGGRVGTGLANFGGRVGTGLAKEFGDTPLKAFSQTLGLGAMGLGLANQQNVASQLGRQTRTIERGQKQALAAAAPAVAFGQKQLEQAQAGKLSPPLEASIEQWKTSAKANMAQRFASMGLGNSTALEQINAEIDKQAVAMRASMLGQEEETGLSALQTGVSAGTGVTGPAQNQQAMLSNLIQSANQTLGLLAGSGER